MIGKIIDICDNIVIVKLAIDISNQTNLVNIHVVFEDNNQKIVGEIRSISLDQVKIAIVGEIKDNKFIPGFSKKPSFKSMVRIIVMDELELILGRQNITDNDQITLGYSTVYNNYKINIGINDFFSNHFAILGNTGSGKSFTVSRLIQNIFTSSNYVPINANIFVFDAYGEYKTAFSRLNEISPMLNTKYYTTNTNFPEGDILKIPLWLLKTDDIALLLEASEPAQLSIIDKALRLVPIIKGTDDRKITCNTEDGEFNVFIPLSESQISDFKDEGIELEAMFSIDSELDDGSVLRIMENRDSINLISVEKGNVASNNDETLIEKRYAEEHNLNVGDKIKISGKEYTICGTGSVPDYEMPLRKMSDSSIDSSSFGLAFFTSDEYNNIMKSSGQMAEDYTYAYTLSKNVSHDDVRDKIKNLDFDYNDVEDIYFQDYQ